MTFINILIVAIWKSRQVFRAYGWGNMPLQAVKLPISHNNVVGENTVLQLNILETGVLTLVVQNSSPTRLRLVGDELWTTRVRTPVSKMFRWRTYNSPSYKIKPTTGHLKCPHIDRCPFNISTYQIYNFQRTAWCMENEFKYPDRWPIDTNFTIGKNYTNGLSFNRTKSARIYIIM